MGRKTVMERIQKRVLRIIFPDMHYNEALESARLTTLCARREELCMKLFSSIEEDSQHKLRHLLPEPNTSCYNFRTARKLPASLDQYQKISQIVHTVLCGTGNVVDAYYILYHFKAVYYSDIF